MKLVRALVAALSLIREGPRQVHDGAPLLRLPMSMRLCGLLFSLVFVGPGPSLAAGPSNQTIMTWDIGHGTQVEYYGADGRTYLWYPGNSRIVPGEWKRQGRDICFRYGANTYNPVTGQPGGSWECVPFSMHESGIVEVREDDLFGLSSRSKVPFKLSAGATTLDKLARKAGLPAAAKAAPVASGLTFEKGDCPVATNPIGLKVTGVADKDALQRAERQWLAENMPDYGVGESHRVKDGKRQYDLIATAKDRRTLALVCFDVTAVKRR